MAAWGGVSLPNVMDMADNISKGPQSGINPGQFLQDWIVNKLPGAVVSLATSIAGRDDGSGALANQALKMGQTPNLFGGILK